MNYVVYERFYVNKLKEFRICLKVLVDVVGVGVVGLFI